MEIIYAKEIPISHFTCLVGITLEDIMKWLLSTGTAPDIDWYKYVAFRDMIFWNGKYIVFVKIWTHARRILPLIFTLVAFLENTVYAKTVRIMLCIRIYNRVRILGTDNYKQVFPLLYVTCGMLESCAGHRTILGNVGLS